MKNFPEWRFENNSWQVVKLGEITERVRRKAPEGSTAPVMMITAGEGFINQEKRYLRRPNAGKSLKNYTLLRRGELAYNHGNSKIRKYGSCFCLKNEDEARVPFVYHCFNFPDDDPRFYGYYLNSGAVDEQLRLKVTASVRINGLLNISYADYMNLNVVRPPFAEQKKIADYLETLDKAVAAQNKKILNWRELKKGLLQKIFSREWKFTDEHGNFYPDWTEKPLGEIVDFLDSKRKPIEKKERRPGIYPYYGAAGIIDYVEDYIFDEELILLTEDGDPHCFLARGKYWVNNHAHVLKAKPGYENAYICYYLKNMDYRKYIEGTAQPKLNQKNCRQLLLKIPCVEEQKKIADYFTELDKIISAENKILENMRLMKKGLLQKLFP